MGAQVRCFRELSVQRVDQRDSPRTVALEHASRGGSDLVTVDADDGARVLVVAAPGRDVPLLDRTAAVIDPAATVPVIVLPPTFVLDGCAVRHWIEFDVAVPRADGLPADDLLEVVRAQLSSESHDVLVMVTPAGADGSGPVDVVRVVPAVDGRR